MSCDKCIEDKSLRWAERDVKGLFLCYVCDDCVVSSLKKYGAHVLSDYQLELCGLRLARESYDQVVADCGETLDPA